MGIRDMGAGAKMGQCFLIVLNIWFAILGLAMIAIGIFVRIGKVGDNRIIEMLRKADLGGLNMGDVIVALSALIIIVGVFTLLLSADGGIGACLQKKGLLIVYIVALLLILIIEVAVLIIWCKFAFGTNTWLREQFNNLFRFYNGVQGANDVYSKGWNTLFMVLDCCGVAPITPFRNDFQFLGTYFWTNPQRGVTQIPYTCCKESNLNNYMFGNNLQCTVARQQPLVRPRGCYEAFRQLATDVSTGAIVLSVLFIITEILAVIAAILLVRAIDREKKGSLDPSNPHKYRGGVHEIALPDSKPR